MDCITTYLIVLAPPLLLMAGWMLDLLLGDPSCLPHPVVAMGKWIGFGEKRLNKGTHRRTKGAVFALFSIAATGCIAYGVLWLLMQTNNTPLWWCAFALQLILVFFCLAGTTLRKEVRDVFRALDRSLENGRRQVGRIVGRDTSELTAQEVRTAALETLAENLSDGVVAPVFWFALLGVPGMLAYKMVNTLDSMIGYKNERYRLFGCWAAHIDDVANYIPARITALLMMVCGWLYAKIRPNRFPKPIAFISLFRFVCHYGPQHASPNSGWPEAALAGLLNCQFGGTHSYFGQEVVKPVIGENLRPLNTNDMRISIRISFFSEILAILLCASVLTLMVIV